MRVRLVRLVAVTALFTSMAFVGLGSSTAGAATVNGCTAWSDGVGGHFCIDVVTGAKNTSNHTQLVVSIKLRAAGAFCQQKWEAWTQNWYKASSGGCYWSTPTWSINKWVGNGNYVCGRGYHWDPTLGWETSKACIQIKV